MLVPYANRCCGSAQVHRKQSLLSSACERAFRLVSSCVKTMFFVFLFSGCIKMNTSETTNYTSYEQRVSLPSSPDSENGKLLLSPVIKKNEDTLLKRLFSPEEGLRAAIIEFLKWLLRQIVKNKIPYMRLWQIRWRRFKLW